MSKVFQQLLDIKSEKGAGYIVLIDPDRKNEDTLVKQVTVANKFSVDALFVGGSLMMDSKELLLLKRKQIFPSSSFQVG